MSKDIDSKKDINETELDAVAGGNIAADCEFVPMSPVDYKYEYGHVWVKCRRHIFNCPCRGTTRCVDNWHKMQKLAEAIWSPWPAYEMNHDKADKAVRQHLLEPDQMS